MIKRTTEKRVDIDAVIKLIKYSLPEDFNGTYEVENAETAEDILVALADALAESLKNVAAHNLRIEGGTLFDERRLPHLENLGHVVEFDELCETFARNNALQMVDVLTMNDAPSEAIIELMIEE